MRLLTALTVAAVAAVGAVGVAHADDGVMKMATVAPTGTPWAALLKKYRQNVKKAAEAAGTEIKIKVYMGGIKGDEQSSVRQVFKGTLQSAGVSTGAVSVLVPAVDTLELPYLFKDFDEADKVLDAVRGELDALLATKGLKLLMYSENGYRSFGGKKFFKTPEDMKAVKMRSQESSVHVGMYRALGASPVTMSVGEVMSGLQTEVVKGFDNTPLFTQAAGWNQAVSHYTVSRHIYQPALILVNKGWFDGLPKATQDILLNEAKALEGKGRKLVRLLNPKLIENLKAGGLEVYEHTAAESEAFRTATRSVWALRRKELQDAGDTTGVAFFDAVMKAKGVAKP
ncbi:MAG: TRAP transporter substrate-binding protein [Myxococcales bacterium]|nr:TRAP transporter substrate-binding protein [Myxococcales bacterium]MCB9522107.1 TRAP transporter substrate-binding protein [Myxococcales bacterium]